MNFYFFDRFKASRNSFLPSEANVLREFETVHRNFLKDIKIQSQYAVEIKQSDIDVEGLVNALFADKQIIIEARQPYLSARTEMLYTRLKDTIPHDFFETKPPRYSPIFYWLKNKFANIISGGRDEKIT